MSLQIAKAKVKLFPLPSTSECVMHSLVGLAYLVVPVEWPPCYRA